MPKKEDRRLRIGVLGCGPIAQAAHFESCTKARNADLYAVCDVADDLRQRMAATHAPERQYADYAAMLADPQLEAVIIATSDAFHVPASIQALEAGKHVLCEKPLGVTVEEVATLQHAVEKKRPGPAGRPHEALRPRPAGREGIHRHRDGPAARAEGLVLRLDAPLHDDRCGAAADGHERRAPQAGKRPEGRHARIPDARARLPPGRHRAVPGRRHRLGAGALVGAFWRALLVCRHRVRERHARPPRPHGRRAHGLARGLAALRPARQRDRQDLQPLVLPQQRR